MTHREALEKDSFSTPRLVTCIAGLILIVIGVVLLPIVIWVNTDLLPYGFGSVAFGLFLSKTSGYGEKR